MSDDLKTRSGDDLITGELMTGERGEVEAAGSRSIENELTKRSRDVEQQLTNRSMNVENRSKNRALVRYWILPLIFLTVALLGGLRVGSDDRAFIFFPPPLITLLLAVLLMLLFIRGGLIELRSWINSNNAPLLNVSHFWVLLTLFFASAQAFNSVLPERGLLHWLFSFFFLWTLWNNQFSSFDARRLLRSLVVLFGTAFVLKHILLSSFYAPDGGWLKSLAGTLVQGVTLGTLDAPMFAPATGYISFFALGLFIAGLVAVSVGRDD